MSHQEIHAQIILAIIFCLGLFILYIDLKNLFRLLWKRKERRPQTKLDSILKWSALTLTLAGILCAFDAFLYEPYHLSVNRIAVYSPKVAKGRMVKIAHLSDFHIDSKIPFEGRLIHELQIFKPDMILLSGDYLNTSSRIDIWQNLASRLSAIAPTYAVEGNWDITEESRRIFQAAGVEYAEARVARFAVGKTGVTLIGIPMNDSRNFRRLSLEYTSDTLNILLTHSPDLIPEAAESGIVDLYFCGHTHGGQVRLPLYGALITLAETGKRFEMGLYRVGGMAAYTNRGVGMEGGAPKVRFLCRPELALFGIIPE